VLPLLIFNEHKQVVTDTRCLKHLEIMNRDKHIWEGWTVGDFIDDIEPTFNTIQRSDGFWDHNAGFKSKAELKKWVASEQPYYKKHIPEVYNYFLQKSGL
jgi:hypothetical protein